MLFKGIASQQFILNDTHLGKNQLFNRNHYQESHRNRITDLSHKNTSKVQLALWNVDKETRLYLRQESNDKIYLERKDVFFRRYILQPMTVSHKNISHTPLTNAKTMNVHSPKQKQER